MKILVLNCGSSSAKFAVIDPESGEEFISGIAQRLGSPQASLDWKFGGKKETKELPGADHDQALREVVALLHETKLADGLRGVGHRVLHAGTKFSGSRLATPDVIAKTEECIPLGPLHNPPNLLGIKIAEQLFPGLKNVAVFDTAFHQTMPPRAYRYAVPAEWHDKFMVRRYGFHGTSHRFVAGQTIKQFGLDPNNSAVITVHLGNGCSCAAVQNGKCVDTTMGLTPLEGVVMGTRCGSVDPALVGYMSKNLGKSAEEIVDFMNKKCGLLGLSGLSNDMRTLVEAKDKGHEGARLAIEVFCYVLAKHIAGLAVPLGRVDVMAFTGGIGENSWPIRAQLMGHLAFLGLSLDEAANRSNGKDTGGRISRETKPQAVIVPTNEELMIARDTAEIVGAA